MPVYSGGTKLYEIKAGSTPITEVYVGATKVFPEAAPTVSITMSPASVSTGGVLTFTATAAGSTTLAYAWYFNGSVIGGQTGSTYARTTVAGDNGDVITCRVTDLYGQTTTSNGQTMVVAGTLSATNPSNTSAANGATAVFSTTASGGLAPYTYQWQRNNVNIGGATAASYTTPALDYAANNGDTYRCVVKDSTATPQQVTTANATLTVTVPALTASIAPTSFSGTEGDVIAFTATAGGGYGAKTYQWQLNNANIGGATAATYNRTTVLSDNGKNIRCIIGDAAGQSANSNACVMTIVAAQGNLYEVIASLLPASWWKLDNPNETILNPEPGSSNLNNIFEADFGAPGVAATILGYPATQFDLPATRRYELQGTVDNQTDSSGCFLIRARNNNGGAFPNTRPYDWPGSSTSTTYHSYNFGWSLTRNNITAIGPQSVTDTSGVNPYNQDLFISWSRPRNGAAGNWVLYVNGVKSVVNNSAGTFFTGLNSLQLGGTNSSRYAGAIGAFAIIPRLLTDAEHLDLWAGAQTPP